MANEIKLDLQGKTVPEKVQFIRDVATALTGNASFTTPAPTLAALTGKADTLGAALTTQGVAQQAAKTATTNLGNAESAADDALNSLSNYVWETSGGDEAKIQSAGLSLRAPKTATTSLDVPGNLAVTAGDNEGELDAQWDPVPKSRGYEVQTSDDPPTSTSWKAGDLPSASKTTLTGLTSGAKQWVRVRALGPKKVKSPWSDPAVKRVP
ncbi:MAG: fibronectin type III domain-containing protein [Verrucomicrobia bacterium]|nr:fibronectin type III domain-containing protein [Verrucomicrobiota bacterium]